MVPRTPSRFTSPPHRRIDHRHPTGHARPVSGAPAADRAPASDHAPGLLLEHPGRADHARRARELGGNDLARLLRDPERATPDLRTERDEEMVARTGHAPRDH